jgi:hypothetical protein
MRRGLGATHKDLGCGYTSTRFTSKLHHAYNYSRRALIDSKVCAIRSCLTAAQSYAFAQGDSPEGFRNPGPIRPC